ncbi:paired amphipathic helix protein sin3-like 2 [Quercus suber]|uniref:Paired amphipathic helix protein sin3-like 2 n=1 Tax=Quercus suber TaxID=58331 RepID=A0AAW0JF92_QUESU
MAGTTENNTLTYLKEVEKTFQDQNDKYYKFLRIMNDFKAKRYNNCMYDTNVPSVIPIVKELFKGHNNLISGINIFLPKGSVIALDKQELFNEAWSFVTKIKERFQNDISVYLAFLDILNELEGAQGHKYSPQSGFLVNVNFNIRFLFYNFHISNLLDGHANLIDEFTRFLPPKAELVSAKKW